jgi:hypothetical protein
MPLKGDSVAIAERIASVRILHAAAAGSARGDISKGSVR